MVPGLSLRVEVASRLGAPKPALSLPKGLDSETWDSTPYFESWEFDALEEVS